MPELNFDGLVGPTHNYAGLAQGNLAAQRHAGNVGNPRAAALEGLDKMRTLLQLGVDQAVLPPQPRPALSELRRLGFGGSDKDVLAAADKAGLLALYSSASSMWSANAATVVPSSDARDGRLQLLVANLAAQTHRAIEAKTTTRVLRAIFADTTRFVVHEPLPCVPHFTDEGAANHTRLATKTGACHLLGWGRSEVTEAEAPKVHLARQTLEASAAIARRADIAHAEVLLWQQAPAGIDAGSFHSDVLCVGHRHVLLLHELAFVDSARLEQRLRAILGPELEIHVATESELPAADAVLSYPFNSQLVTTKDGSMAIIAPTEARDQPTARAYLERVVFDSGSVSEVHWVAVNGSMKNGGGPACLRLRILLTEAEVAALPAGVIMNDAQLTRLEAWVRTHYRPSLALDDLRDPLLFEESCRALDELTTLLGLGSIYEFQQST
jgi:succinylarginine dihydrolase